jgi:hypothetical protein
MPQHASNQRVQLKTSLTCCTLMPRCATYSATGTGSRHPKGIFMLQHVCYSTRQECSSAPSHLLNVDAALRCVQCRSHWQHCGDGKALEPGAKAGASQAVTAPGLVPKAAHQTTRQRVSTSSRTLKRTQKQAEQSWHKQEVLV